MTKMKKIIRHIFFPAFVAIVLLPIPSHAMQAMFVTKSDLLTAGEPIVVEVRLATQEDAINAVEGVIQLPNDVSVEQVHTGGSSFTLWPNAPKYVPGTHTIEFTGGVPGGIAPHQQVLVFSFTMRAPIPGSYPVSVKKITTYLNDGYGTAVRVPLITQKFSVGEGDAPALAKAKDVTAPEFISVELGSDPTLFDGKSYVTFFAKDAESGVVRYEVKEGFFSVYTPADTYYVLKDQSLKSAVKVRAIDAAGNSATYTVSSSNRPLLVLAAISLLLGATMFIVRRLRGRKKTAHV